MLFVFILGSVISNHWKVGDKEFFKKNFIWSDMEKNKKSVFFKNNKIFMDKNFNWKSEDKKWFAKDKLWMDFEKENNNGFN